MYTGAWGADYSAMLGGMDLKAVRPREEADIVILFFWYRTTRCFKIQ